MTLEITFEIKDSDLEQRRSDVRTEAERPTSRRKTGWPTSERRFILA